MKYNDLREYFDTYVTNYEPYKNDLIYQHLTKFLLDYYYDHSYNQIPTQFRSLYENQIITTDLYDYILTSNGFPPDVVNSMQLRDKFILISTFMDFNKYKGTIEIVRRVANAYTEKFNIYELFIDYDEVKQDWVFVPYLIYECPELSNLVLTADLDFDYISYSTKLFFITRDYLDGLKENAEIVFPIKTNLLFLDYVVLYQENDLSKLLASIVFNEYKSNKIILYFEDNNYQITLENAYKLWYYIIFKAYPNLELVNLPGSYIQFNITNTNFPFTIADIPTIKSEYANINSRSSLSNFQTKYLDVFRDIQINTATYTSSKMCTLYEKVLDPSLIAYVNYKLSENTTNHPEKLLINSDYILDQIYNSLITWEYSFDDYNKSFEYIGYFISILPLMYLKFENTSPYILIDYLKPFHVELVLRNQDMVRVNDKFNQVFYDSKKNFITNMIHASIMSISYNYINSITIVNDDNLPIVSISNFNMLVNILEKLIIVDDSVFDITHQNQSMLNIGYAYSNRLIQEYNNNLPIINSLDFKCLSLVDASLFIVDKYEYVTNMSSVLDFNVGYGYDINSTMIPIANLQIIHSFTVAYIPP